MLSKWGLTFCGRPGIEEGGGNWWLVRVSATQTINQCRPTHFRLMISGGICNMHRWESIGNNC